VRESLEKLDLLIDGIPTNAAILLFGRDPQKFFGHSEIRCARFKGTKPLEFIDMKVFGGNLIDQREDAVEFVKEHIKLHAKIVGLERVETWEYPIDAIREAVTNAICHRDYEECANAQVRIFDDRIEIWGCGALPEPLTVDDLKQSHRSILRNPLIGKCLFLIKFIEHWGTGTNRWKGSIHRTVFHLAKNGSIHRTVF
jgi:ATP-dependent DNA helicase RecG